MIAPEAYRILGETMALADVFPQPLGQLANGLRPHEHTTVLLRTLWAYRGLGGDLTRTAAALAVNRSTARYQLYHIRELTVGASGKGPTR
jgi:sugar diacid utilization regulator